jgi:hypothetical protein
MNKHEISEKNIVLDLSPSEFTILFTAFGYAGEDLIDQNGKNERKQFYMAMLQLHREDFERLGERVMKMFVALHEKV